MKHKIITVSYTHLDVYKRQIQIYPEPEQKLARVKVVIKGAGITKIKLSAESFNTDTKHIVPAIQQEIKLNKGVTETEMVLPMGNDMQMCIRDRKHGMLWCKMPFTLPAS